MLTLFAAFAAPLPGFAYSFLSNLRLGDSGIDVAALQQTLNASPDTLVASSGPGSLGQETAYFGGLTLDAVNRFQTKYRAEILTPNGLAAPTGLVGPSTRAQLELVSTPISAPVSASVPDYTPTRAPSAPASTVTASTIATAGAVTLPSMSERTELYIAEVKKQLKDSGEANEHIALIEEAIRKISPQAQKSTDDFFEQQQEFFNKQAKLDGPVIAFVKDSLSAMSSFFIGEKAQAALGLPFGGYVATVWPVCTCTPAVSQIFVFLANPNVAVTNMNLDYVLGTQAFNWHSLPLPGIATLGLYEPITPSCWIHIGTTCFPIISRGLITPIVGSSLIPL